MTFAEVRDFGRPIVHLDVDVGCILAVPCGILSGIGIPYALKVCRLCARLEGAYEQIASELEIKGSETGVVSGGKFCNAHVGRLDLLRRIAAEVKRHTVKLRGISRRVVCFGLVVVLVEFFKNSHGLGVGIAGNILIVLEICGGRYKDDCTVGIFD